LQDPEAYDKEKAEKELQNEGDKGVECTSYQSQTPRRPRGVCQGQGLQGPVKLQMHPQGKYSSFQTQADHSQAMPQMQQASAADAVRQSIKCFENTVIRMLYSNQYHHNFQVNLSIQGKCQECKIWAYFLNTQVKNQCRDRHLCRQCRVIIGESPQILFYIYREGTPTMMPGSPQSQSVRSDRHFPAPSDQCMLPIGALGGNPTQSTDRDRFSGSETSANTAIQ
jgi:hypothetical protein